MQELVRCGAQCWVLYPGSGRRPMAKGIAGSAPAATDNGGGIARTLLMELCEDGKQLVRVTKVHKKNIQLMYPELNAELQHLEDFTTPPAPNNTWVTWSTRYLVEKATDT